MVRPGIQMVIFNESLDSLRDLLHRVNDAGFEGVEFAYRLFESDSKTIARTLDRTGLEPIGGHATPGDLDARLREGMAVYRQIGCSQIVVSHFDGRDFASREGVASVARDIESFSERAAEHGFTLAYHNDGFENVRIDEDTLALEVLVSELDDDVSLQLDVKHVLQGGLDPIDFLARHGERIDTLHFRDTIPGVEYSVALGQGEIDLDALVDTAIKQDVEWLIYEGNPRLDSLPEAIEYMEAAIAKR